MKLDQSYVNVCDRAMMVVNPPGYPDTRNDEVEFVIRIREVRQQVLRDGPRRNPSYVKNRFLLAINDPAIVPVCALDLVWFTESLPYRQWNLKEDLILCDVPSAATQRLEHFFSALWSEKERRASTCQ